jgi:hypothetical protein
MATNFFFRNTDYIPEQNLLNNLATEMIKIFGVDVYYIIRTTGTTDPLFTEAASSSFTLAVPIEMYINTYEGFRGEGDLLTKFGLSIADKLVLSVSRERFAEDIGSQYSLIRPNEGDLVYFPLSKGLFEIKFVEHEAAFYQTGALQYYELQLEKFNYNSETFNTGIADIDAVQANYSTSIDNFYILTEDGYHLQTESGYDIELETFALDATNSVNQNQEFQTFANTFVDFSITDPFSEGGKY